MDSTEANKQIAQMISFIEAEAKDKEEEIFRKGQEEVTIEIHRRVAEGKEKIRQNYEKRVKQIDSQYAIKKSMAINKQRLEKIKARQEVIATLADEVKQQLKMKTQGDAAARPFVTKLITQGLLMLLEPEVMVKCRESDKAMVQSCLVEAQNTYSQIIKQQTGGNKQCRAAIDNTSSLPDSCMGGVVLSCQNGKITIDNTIDLRLSLVLEQDKPMIRKQLFNGK